MNRCLQSKCPSSMRLLEPLSSALAVAIAAGPASGESLRDVCPTPVGTSAHPPTPWHTTPRCVSLDILLTGEHVLYDGPVRELCRLAPNNVNTMAVAAIAAGALAGGPLTYAARPVAP